MFKKLIIISILLNIFSLTALAKGESSKAQSPKSKEIRLIKKTTQERIRKTSRKAPAIKKKAGVNINKGNIKKTESVKIKNVKADTSRNSRIEALMAELKSLQELLLKTPAQSQTASLGSLIQIQATSTAAREEEIPLDFVLNQRQKLFLTSFEGRGSKGYDTGFWTINYPYWFLNWTFADFSNQGQGSGGVIVFKIYRQEGASEVLINTITSGGDGHRYLKGNGLYKVIVEAGGFSGWSVDMRAVRDK